MLILRPTGIIAGRIRRREDVREIAHNQSMVSTKLNTTQGRVLAVIMLVLLAFARCYSTRSAARLLSSLVIAGIFFIALLASTC